MTTDTTTDALAEAADSGKIVASRRDISIYERTANHNRYDDIEPGWYATFSGRTSTGEYVSFGRRGDTMEEALSALEAEIEAMGWELK